MFFSPLGLGSLANSLIELDINVEVQFQKAGTETGPELYVIYGVVLRAKTFFSSQEWHEN
jgi:hypothetical protein